MSEKIYHIQVFKDKAYNGIDIINEALINQKSLKLKCSFIKDLLDSTNK